MLSFKPDSLLLVSSSRTIRRIEIRLKPMTNQRLFDHNLQTRSFTPASRRSCGTWWAFDLSAVSGLNNYTLFLSDKVLWKTGSLAQQQHSSQPESVRSRVCFHTQKAQGGCHLHWLNLVFPHLNTWFPLTYLYEDESTRSPFIPMGISVISNVPSKLLPSIILRSRICTDYVEKT